ncbi:MAG TPA: toll/interleukin-1 receptor domain-containing protein, partial [Anaerolineales bacterium]|nr:toll/interleukin-1 receptor domain-containing protein [Anaerolineales bacterium]
YSHADTIFVNKLSDCLSDKGIRFWRDVPHATAGRLEKQIDRAIRQNPTVLLVLSEHSLRSDWVEHEVHSARRLEKEIGRDVLCPIALDESWKNHHWPKRIMEQVMEYNILDFSAWEDDVKFEGMFHKLIDGLELFYKG